MNIRLEQLTQNHAYASNVIKRVYKWKYPFLYHKIIEH